MNLSLFLLYVLMRCVVHCFLNVAELRQTPFNYVHKFILSSR